MRILLGLWEDDMGISWESSCEHYGNRMGTMEKAWEYPGETLGNTMVILGEYSGNRTVILREHYGNSMNAQIVSDIPRYCQVV